MKRVATALLLAITALVALPAGASAATWVPENETCGGFNSGEWGSGQMDAAGLLYVPCSRSYSAERGYYQDYYVAVIDSSGARVRRIPLNFGDGYLRAAADIAPSPDGSFLYVVRYDSFTVHRFDRQPDGSYVFNAGWALGTFPWDGGGGANLPRGVFIATDGNGDIYLSAGLWTCGDGSPHCTDNAIVKYRANGSYVTRFGRKVGGSWALGDAHGSFGGVAVTADGARVFVTDINNSRVQRFDRAADGSYGAVLAMGMNQNSDPTRSGACYGDGVLAAPYDLTLSPAGELLVINTTCFATATFYADRPAGTIEVQRFGQDGSVRGSIMSRSSGDSRVHGIAVDRGGNVHLIQGRVLLRPAAGWSEAGAAAGGGGPLGGSAAATDATAPTLLSVTGPATTAARAVTITIQATDDRAVTELRLRVDGALGGWQPYTASLMHTLADRYGSHAIAIQVRDAAGNVSAERGISIDRPAPAPAPTPTPTPVPTPTPANPAGPTNPVGPTVSGGGGAAAGDVTKPVINDIRVPVQVFRGRVIRVTATASDEVAVTQLRLSTSGGRWGAWQDARGAARAMLPAGAGWKGVFIQVRDAAGNRSSVWFQPVLMGARGIGWYKAGAGTEIVRGGRGSQHVDSSNFDGGAVDRIACGAGFDTVYAQPEDLVSRDCERVTRVQMPVW